MSRATNLVYWRKKYPVTRTECVLPKYAMVEKLLDLTSRPHSIKTRRSIYIVSDGTTTVHVPKIPLYKKILKKV